MTRKQHNTPKKRIWPWMLVAVMIILLTGIRFAMRSDMVLDRIRSEIEVRLSGMLRAELQIDRLHGDLWRQITAENIRLYAGGGDADNKEVFSGTEKQPVVHLDSLTISYSVVDLIFRRPLSIKELHIHGLRAEVGQDEDGLWNILALLPEMEVTDMEDVEYEAADPVSFVVEDIRVTAPRINVDATALLPGEPLSVRDLVLHTRAGRDESGFFADVYQLDLAIHESRLDDAIRLSSEASWDGRRITLDKLLITGAYSMAEMTGSYNTITSAVDFRALFDPLAWQEAEAYFAPYPFRENLSVSFHLGGSRQNLNAGLTVRAVGLEELQVSSQWSLLQEPVLTSLSVVSGSVDAGKLTGSDTLNAGFESLDFSMSGAIPMGEWDRLSVNGDLVLNDLRYGEYDVDQLNLTLDTELDTVRSHIRLTKRDEVLNADLEAVRWWEEDFEWMFAYETTGISTGFWSGLTELDGYVASSGILTGQGLAPGPVPWTADITLDHVQWPGFPDVHAGLRAELTPDSLLMTGNAGSGNGRLEVEAGVHWSGDLPAYDGQIQFQHLNAGLFAGLEQLPTDINGALAITGTGIDPESMILDASLLLNNSTIINEYLDSAWLEIVLRDGIMRTEEAFLESNIATAKLSLEQNIFDFRDIGNRLDFDMELLDLQGFAGLAGIDTLQAKGRMTGVIQSDQQGRLVLNSGLDLTDVRYDTLKAAQIQGTAMIILYPETDYTVELEIRDPSLGAHTIRDIALYTEGNYTEAGVRGMFDFEFSIENESGYRQQSDYVAESDTIRLRTHDIILTDPAGTYRLQKPFDLMLAEQTVLLDTLHLVSGHGSELTMSVRKTPDTPWAGFFEAFNTDLGQIQYVFLDQPLFEAMLTGRIGFILDEDDITMDGRTDISRFRMQSLALDSISLAFDAAGRRLTTDLHVHHDGKELIRSELDLPFDPYYTGEPGHRLLEEPINGYLLMDTLDVSRFEAVLNDAGLEGMRGVLSFRTTLSGNAGMPEMKGELRLQNGALSGVAVDTLLLDWDYDHNRSDILLNARVHSLGQKAADISSRLPLRIDLPEMTVHYPESEDPLDVMVNTSDFDLAALNDFLNPEQMSNLQGLLDANVEIRGTLGDPLMDGRITLRNGQIFLVQNNVTLRNIGMEAGLAPGILELRRLSMQSSGSFNGRGTVTMDGLTPDELDLRFNATNFRVFNTRDIEFYAGLNVRLGGTMEEPVLTGDFRWDRGTIFIDDFGERDVEEVVLDEDVPEPEERPDLLERLGMEVRFIVDRNAFLRNRRDPEINLALRGELDVVKEPYGELQIFGDMSVPSGHVTTFNKRFQLERGDLLFSGEPANPELNIRTLFRPRQQYEDIRIYFLITGTISEPRFEFDSDPEMELQDIVSYTLFGRPFHALAGWEQTVSGRTDGSLATHIAVDIVLDRIETLAADRLGIDVIEIENTRRGGGSGTSIKAGKFVSDRLFVAFLQELGGSESGRQVMVEYLISRNLELILTAGDDYRSGVDMLWRYDY